MTPEDVVRGFLPDVRSGEQLDRADGYLATTVRAHQGRPGCEHAVVARTPRSTPSARRRVPLLVEPAVERRPG